MEWNLACPDWEERLRTGKSLVPTLPLFKSEADMAVEAFEGLRLPDVPKLPYLRDAAGDWQKDIVRATFGSVDPVSQERHIREFFVLVAKKNNKTTGSAAIMVTALLMNTRPMAEFILVAPTQEVSSKPFTQAAGMIRADPALDADQRGRFRIRDNIKTIEDLRNGSTLKVKSFSAKILTGVIPAGILVDELHVLGKDIDAANVMIQLRGGLVSNPAAFLFFISTQSDEPPEGVFKTELDKARAIRDGKLAGDMLPILYEYPADMQAEQQWRDPENWWMVNPNFGRSLHKRILVGQWRDAELEGEEAVRRFASQHLNVEIGLGLLGDRWAGADFWEQNKVEFLKEKNPPNSDKKTALTEIINRCEVVVIGIDGGGLDDLLGICVLGREKNSRRWLAWCHAWAHEIVLQRRKSEAAKIKDFEKAGELTLVKTPGDDVQDVADIVMLFDKEQLLPEDNAIGVDSVGIGDIRNELAAREFDCERIIGISQGWRLNGAIKTTERQLAGGRLVHAGTALMNWCVRNAKIEPAGNAVKITKQAAGTAKIDPLAALFDAVELMNREPEAARSVYEEEEIPYV